MSDISEALRVADWDTNKVWDLTKDAADEIERLEKLVEEMRSLLSKADEVIIWSASPYLGKGFQDEIEAVLSKALR